MDLEFILFLLDICSWLPLTAGATLDCATMASVVASERRRLLRNYIPKNKTAPSHDAHDA